MKRAIGLIAATLVTASVYSQDYSSSSTSNPDSTPDYQSRQSESGAPATSDSSSSSSSAAGYDRAPGSSGGNSSTGQSNGSNIGSPADQDQSLTTRDSDVSGSEYHGTLQNDSSQSDPSNSGSSGTSVGGSSSSSEGTVELKGSGTADGAFHEPAAPVREGSQSEGWSGSATFSGAGPGAVTGSASSQSGSIPAPTESSNSFSADVSNNSALSDRYQDLSNRGIEPDSDQLSRTDAFSNQSNDDLDMDRNNAVILEDWTIVTPGSESNVGAPANSEIGVGSSSDFENSSSRSDASVSGSVSSDSYAQDLYRRAQKDWSARTGTTDVPATPGLMDQSLEQLGHVRFYNETSQSDVGAPGSSVSGSGKSADAECDTHKGSAAEFEQGSSERNADQGASKYHINRGDDEKYHFNREAGDETNSGASTTAPGEYGDRPDNSHHDDGHLNGNNAAGNSDSSERSSSSSESQKNTDGALTQPDL